MTTLLRPEGIRHRIRRAATDPQTHRGLAFGAVLLGTVGIRFLIEDTLSRLDRLEKRGLMPVDDFATLGDLENLRADLVGDTREEPEGPPEA